MSRPLFTIFLSLLLLASHASQPGRGASLTERSWPGTHAMQLGARTITVEIAGTGRERTRGLSGRPDLAADSGLLFVYLNSDIYGIWMKEMNFAIDILWISEDLRVIHIAENVSPATYPEVFMSREPARYVLEMKALSARRLGVEVGTPARLPAILTK